MHHPIRIFIPRRNHYQPRRIQNRTPTKFQRLPSSRLLALDMRLRTVRNLRVPQRHRDVCGSHAITIIVMACFRRNCDRRLQQPYRQTDSHPLFSCRGTDSSLGTDGWTNASNSTRIHVPDASTMHETHRLLMPTEPHRHFQVRWPNLRMPKL